jgi:hypothetical protein
MSDIGSYEEATAGCGLPGHRYGTTDTEHDFDAMGCVNSLRAALRDCQKSEVVLTEEWTVSEDLQRIKDSRTGDGMWKAPKEWKSAAWVKMLHEWAESVRCDDAACSLPILECVRLHRKGAI